MNRLGRYAVYLGVLMIFAGLVVGFTALFTGATEVAVTWLSIIPIGFVVLLVGTVVSQLHRRDD